MILAKLWQSIPVGKWWCPSARRCGRLVALLVSRPSGSESECYVDDLVRRRMRLVVAGAVCGRGAGEGFDGVGWELNLDLLSGVQVKPGQVAVEQKGGEGRVAGHKYTRERQSRAYLVDRSAELR